MVHWPLFCVIALNSAALVASYVRVFAPVLSPESSFRQYVVYGELVIFSEITEKECNKENCPRSKVKI